MLKKKRDIEDELGFYPTPTCNYILTIFNIKTKYRDIFLDGAVPLHSFAPLLYDILYHYINNSNKYEKYTFSVIIKEKKFLNFIVLSNYDNKIAKINECKKYIEKLFSIFDTSFDVFIKEDLSKKNKYRKDTTFKTLRDSNEIYI